MDIFVVPTKVAATLLFSKSVYLVEEHSFINHELSDASLMINQQYLSLDVCLKDNLITGVSGYFNITNCPERSLDLLEGESGRVEVVSAGFPLESGVGYSYPVVGEAFYDRRKRVLQIREAAQIEEGIRITDNIILGVAKEQIVGIQIKIEGQTGE